MTITNAVPVGYHASNPAGALWGGGINTMNTNKVSIGGIYKFDRSRHDRLGHFVACRVRCAGFNEGRFIIEYRDRSINKRIERNESCEWLYPVYPRSL
jgi:hypothetical protein